MPSSPWDLSGDASSLAALWMLMSVRGFGAVSALTAWQSGLDPDTLLERPELLPFAGARASGIISGIRALSKRDRERSLVFARAQVEAARATGVSLVGYDHPSYPVLVRESSFPCPILWVAGDVRLLDALSDRSVALVGSRSIGEPYSTLHATAAHVAVALDFVVVSGFALGADSIGHREAHRLGGRTAAVLPCGLDQVFPPENRPLHRDLLDKGHALFMSQFPLGTRSDAIKLRARNRLVVAASLGVLVSQSRSDGGAMIAYRAALQERRPVATFASDGSERSSGNSVIARNGRLGTTCLGPWVEGMENMEGIKAPLTAWIRSLGDPWRPGLRATGSVPPG
jgi:DNA processing protein